MIITIVKPSLRRSALQDIFFLKNLNVLYTHPAHQYSNFQLKVSKDLLQLLIYIIWYSLIISCVVSIRSKQYLFYILLTHR